MNHKIKLDGQNIKFGNGQNIEVELTEEQIIELHSRLQNKGEKYFFPEETEDYTCLTSYGISDETYTESETHVDTVNRGVFRTEEQAKKEDEKRKALVRMWKWVQENGLFFEPDWSDDTQNKYYPYFCYYLSNKNWFVYSGQQNQTNFLFPHFKSQSDCQKFIDNNLSELNLFV